MNIEEKEIYNMNITLNYYDNLKILVDNHLNYLKTYKVLTTEYYNKLIVFHQDHINKKEKIISQISKIKNIDLTHNINISEIVPRITTLYLENLKYFIEEVDKSITTFQKINEEKELIILKLKSTFKDSKNDLSHKIKDIEKSKKNFINQMENTEKLLIEYYSNKNKISNENNNIINQKQITEEQINESINSAKQYEKNYILEAETGKSFEDTFTIISKCSIENIKQSILDIANKLKKSVIEFLLPLRNSFKVPISEMEYYIPEITSYEEDKKLDEKIKKFFNKENNIENKFIKNSNYIMKSIISEYDDFTLTQNGNLKCQFLYVPNDKNIIKLEDGLDEMYFLNNEAVLMTAKKMKNSFKLISTGDFDLKSEEEKINTNKLTEKLLLSIPKNEVKNDINIKTITEKEIKELEILLDKHHNRVIFFQKLNEYRSKGNFYLPKKIYILFGKLFNLCIDKIKRDNDLHTGRNCIILSQTYYCIGEKSNEYIQFLISKNQLFKDVDFWKQLIEMELGKEIKKLSTYLSKEGVNNLNGSINNDLENTRFSNIAFSQIITIADNMIEFGLDINKVNEVIEPKIEYFKLNEALRQNIKEMIDTKIKSKKKSDKSNEICKNNINNNDENNNYINEINTINK